MLHNMVDIAVPSTCFRVSILVSSKFPFPNSCIDQVGSPTSKLWRLITLTLQGLKAQLPLPLILLRPRGPKPRSLVQIPELRTERLGVVNSLADAPYMTST